MSRIFFAWHIWFLYSFSICFFILVSLYAFGFMIYPDRRHILGGDIHAMILRSCFDWGNEILNSIMLSSRRAVFGLLTFMLSSRKRRIEGRILSKHFFSIWSFLIPVLFSFLICCNMRSIRSASSLIVERMRIYVFIESKYILYILKKMIYANYYMLLRIFIHCVTEWIT